MSHHGGQLLLAHETISQDRFILLAPNGAFCWALTVPKGWLGSGVGKKDNIREGMFSLPYADADVIIELWKYDPVLLSRDGMVDPLSLVMSFDDNEDERM